MKGVGWLIGVPFVLGILVTLFAIEILPYFWQHLRLMWIW